MDDVALLTGYVDRQRETKRRRMLQVVREKEAASGDGDLRT